MSNRQNHAVGVPFEPGSVFKVITLSAALETTALRPESLIDNRFASSDGKLIFAVTGADFSKQSFPIAISVAYRTLAGVKFGLISMTPKP